jgi:hypothetical protein
MTSNYPDSLFDLVLLIGIVSNMLFCWLSF